MALPIPEGVTPTEAVSVRVSTLDTVPQKVGMFEGVGNRERVPTPADVCEAVGDETKEAVKLADKLPSRLL